MNVLNFKKKEDFNKYRIDKTYNSIMCKQIGYKHPDKLYT